MSLIKFTGFDGFVGITGQLSGANFPSTGSFARYPGGTTLGSGAEFAASAQRYGSGLGLRCTGTGSDGTNNISRNRALAFNLEGVMLAGNGIVVGQSVRVRSFPTAPIPADAGVPIGCLSNQTGAGIIGVCITGAGYLTLRTTSSTPLAVAVEPLAGNQWYFVEIDIDYAAGNITGVKVFVNGAQLLTWTGSIASNPVDWCINFSPNGSYPVNSVTGAEMDFDDLYFIAKDATSPNTRLGEHRITAFSPDTLVGAATIGFTQYGSGTVQAVVGIGSIDGDATGFTGEDLNDRLVLSSSQTLPGNVLSVAGVAVSMVAAKSGAEERKLAPIIRSDGEQENGTERSMSDVFGVRQSTFTLNPDGDVPWDKSSVEDAHFGVLITE